MLRRKADNVLGSATASPRVLVNVDCCVQPKGCLSALHGRLAPALAQLLLACDGLCSGERCRLGVRAA